MYGKIIDGNITTLSSLPIQYEDEKGLHLNFRNVSDPSDYGFYKVVTPSYDPINQMLGEIKFDKKKKVFTYSIANINFDSTSINREGKTVSDYDIDLKRLELIKDVKKEAKTYLNPTDWYILRKAERNVDVPSKIVTERSSIVTKAETFEKEIKALKTYESLLRYSIAFFPSKELK